MKQFSYDWFSHNIGNWTSILKDVKDKPNLKALEIGCFEGRATVWLLENILTHETSRIQVVDTFEGSIEHKDRGMTFTNMREVFLSNIQEHKNKVSVFQGTSSLFFRTTPPTEYDLIYIDGSHQAPDVLLDAVCSFLDLKNGGIMIFDDYEWNAYPQDINKNPKPAIDTFLSIYKERLEIIHKQYQVAIRKK